MLVQAQHRFTVEDYYRMAETGVLKPDACVELLDGKIIDMSPIGPFHGSISKHLNKIFSAAAKGRWITALQDSVRLNDHSEPQPDLLKPVLIFIGNAIRNRRVFSCWWKFPTLP
jgi:Uma2 family endonuclease